MWFAVFAAVAGAQDIDLDGVVDVLDTCPAIANPGQADNDRDGQGASCECNDNDASVMRYYPDEDGDGWGVASVSVCSPFQDPSWVSRAGDCNDFSATTYPSAPEVADGIDNDCDGAVDEPEELDNDGDGWAAGDCDDTDPTVYPGAIEVALDGVDSNCDGLDGSTLLEVLGPFAGLYYWRVSDAVPGGTVALLMGTGVGTTDVAIPGCGMASVDMTGVTLAATLTTPGTGVATATHPGPGPGVTLGFQAFDVTGCTQTGGVAVSF